MKFITTMYVTLSESLGIYTADQLYELLSNRHHTQPISRHRAAIIQSRTFFFSTVFAVLVPLWSLIDLIFLPLGLWAELLSIRLLSALIFAAVAWQTRQEPCLKQARWLLAVMLSVTPLFYLASNHWIEAYELSGMERVVAELYALLPFVMVAGLTLFPLTLSEFLAYAVPMILVVVWANLPNNPQ
ncbi:MAG: hypothetical protein P8101_18810, partial [Candidatus Thiodiazotropha sp.]